MYWPVDSTVMGRGFKAQNGRCAKVWAAGGGTSTKHVPWLGRLVEEASGISIMRLHSGHLDRVPFFFVLALMVCRW